MHILERVEESDPTPTMCVTGCSVALIFLMPYYICHRYMSMYILKM